MKHPTTLDELKEFSLYKERLKQRAEANLQRAPLTIALRHQKQALQELSTQKITNPQEAKINSRKKYAMRAAIARTEAAMKG